MYYILEQVRDVWVVVASMHPGEFWCSSARLDVVQQVIARHGPRKKLRYMLGVPLASDGIMVFAVSRVVKSSRVQFIPANCAYNPASASCNGFSLLWKSAL